VTFWRGLLEMQRKLTAANHVPRETMEFACSHSSGLIAFIPRA